MNTKPKTSVGLMVGTLLLLAASLTAQSGDPSLALPWKVGDTWWLHHGSHANIPGGSGAWSSLDFAPAPGTNNEVRAARGGTVVKSTCKGTKVVIDHGDGWFTGYYHLDNIPALIDDSDGSYYVARGRVLGTVSQRATCGGGADIPHVHFSVRYGQAESHVAFAGKYVGGWEVKNGSYQRYGSMDRYNVSITRPSGYWNAANDYNPTSTIYNDGMIGNHTCYYNFNAWTSYSDPRKILIAAYNSITVQGFLGGGATLIAQSKTINTPNFSMNGGKLLFDSENNPCTSIRKQALILSNQLIDFQGHMHEGNAELSWEYRDSVPASYFLLERTTDRQNYTYVDRIEAPQTRDKADFSYVDESAGLINQTWIQYRLTIGYPEGGEHIQERFVRVLRSEVSANPEALNLDLSVDAGGDIQLHLRGALETEALHYHIYDVQGALLLEGSVDRPDANPEHRLPTAAFSTGVYFVRVVQGSQAVSKKIFKY